MYISQPVPSKLAITILTFCGLVTCFLVIAVSREVQKITDTSPMFSIPTSHDRTGTTSDQ